MNEKLSDLRLSKNMKYTALYTAMRFFETSPDIFEKTYSSYSQIKIDSKNQKVFINDKESFELSTHESFVMLEFINRVLSNGYSLTDFRIASNLKSICFLGFTITFLVWDDSFCLPQKEDKSVLYKSRLISGVLEFKTKIHFHDNWYDYGLFDIDGCHPSFAKASLRKYHDSNFVVEENRLMKYVGRGKKVIVPEGIEEIESSAFWDNQYIKEVVLPNTLTNLGGDTFYNCQKLEKITIPKNVNLMGNNPFAGCPLIKVNNESPFFVFENGILYSKDKKTLIYCSIKGDSTELLVPDSVEVIGKHAFYLCDRFRKITLPKSLKKMENNPFSGCSKLELINHSDSYFIKDDVIYNGYKTAVIGSLSKIKSNHLEIMDGVESINRNSFWNCKGIKEIVLPSSLMDIGYNPFVECSNIHFSTKSTFFNVVDDVLMNKDCSKIICYPAWKAVGHVDMPDSVITLERGAFSGCDKMASISLKNVNIINKSCFTNCTSLESVYCSDLITYIGEWAFAYCKSLKRISISKDAVVDNNALSNCPASLVKRNASSNYIIESENLFTLKGMSKAYKGRIDSILIDPPYNSKIPYIGYKDSDYSQGYLTFMEERLKASYPLLSEKGFLVINIDQGEKDNLLKLSKQIFGEKLVTIHRWKKKHPFFDKNRVVLNPNKIQTDFEYIIICRKTKNSLLNQIMQPFFIGDELHEKEAEIPETFDCFGTTSSAKDEINALFGRRDFFSTPKPVKLIKELIRATTNKESIIMDYFAGSGTVGQAVDELNKEDNGERKYILVSNNESDICKKVTVERMKKTGSEFVFLD